MCKRISKLISVCSVRDLDIWEFSHPYILKHIDADEYEVIVPEDCIDKFTQVTDNKVLITSEKEYIRDELLNALKNEFNNKIPGRFGWYLQQFIKIEACSRQKSNRPVIIWDADTVPLKDLQFVNAGGVLEIYVGNEQHEPYFKTLEALTGIRRQVNFSFIAQCLPIYPQWVKEFIAEIERKFPMDWRLAIAKCIFGNNFSEFSEYESLGNYSYSKFPHLVTLSENSKNWYRYGSALFGQNFRSIDRNRLQRFSKYYDFISFESWDNEPYRGVNLGCGDGRLEKTLQGSRMLNLDIQAYPTVDLCLDVTEPSWYLPTESFEHVIINNVLEHIDDVLSVFREIDRILKRGGILQFEVPFIGSYNHGTDITHKRGFTFDSFNFLFADKNYLYRFPQTNPFKYKVLQFWRENILDGHLVREVSADPPERKNTSDWVSKCLAHEIPGTFGFILQKTNE